MSKVLVIVWGAIPSSYGPHKGLEFERRLNEVLGGYYGIQEFHLFCKLSLKDTPSSKIVINTAYCENHRSLAGMRQQSDAKILGSGRLTFTSHKIEHCSFEYPPPERVIIRVPADSDQLVESEAAIV